MAGNILGLGGYNKSTGTNKLFAVYGNDIVDVDTNTGYSQNLTPANNGEFATYLDYSYFVNGVNNSRSFDGTSWSQTGVRNRMPIAKYIMPYGVKLYVANIIINSQSYTSRVWKTDLPYNNKPRWGLEWGSNLSQTKDSAVVGSDGAYFEKYGIKAGDKLFVLTGTNTGEYTVSSVDSDNQLTLVETLGATVASSTFIVGSNYFDVKTNDNDYIRGLGNNSDRLLIFKLNSLHRYNGSSLYQVKGAVGTSSGRSIINVGNYTLYFHGSQATNKTGVYAYDGTTSERVSSAIQPYIDGISSDIFSSIVAWREGDWARFYVGDITNAQRNISVSKAVISFDTVNGWWSIDPITKTVKASCEFLEDNQEKIFFGDNAGEVFQTPSGCDFDGSPIPWAVETNVHYPVGTEGTNTFTRIQVISRDARGVAVRYKLYNTPSSVDDTWQPLGEIEDDKTEFTIPISHRWGSGIQLRFEEIGIRENSQYIEKITIFYLLGGTKFV